MFHTYQASKTCRKLTNHLISFL